jgi:hypothetical protein
MQRFAGRQLFHFYATIGVGAFLLAIGSLLVAPPARFERTLTTHIAAPLNVEDVKGVISGEEREIGHVISCEGFAMVPTKFGLCEQQCTLRRPQKPPDEWVAASAEIAALCREAITTKTPVTFTGHLCTNRTIDGKRVMLLVSVTLGPKTIAVR